MSPLELESSVHTPNQERERARVASLLQLSKHGHPGETCPGVHTWPASLSAWEPLSSWWGLKKKLEGQSKADDPVHCVLHLQWCFQHGGDGPRDAQQSSEGASWADGDLGGHAVTHPWPCLLQLSLHGGAAPRPICLST